MDETKTAETKIKEKPAKAEQAATRSFKAKYEIRHNGQVIAEGEKIEADRALFNELKAVDAIEGDWKA